MNKIKCDTFWIIHITISTQENNICIHYSLQKPTRFILYLIMFISLGSAGKIWKLSKEKKLYLKKIEITKQNKKMKIKI